MLFRSRKFEYTFSGHYHHKSNSDGIYYLGNPYELTWMDYQDQRGFHIFDVDSRDLVFHQNPFVMFHRFVYNDNDEDYSNIDVEYLKNKYVKVVVVSSTIAAMTAETSFMVDAGAFNLSPA